MRPARACFGRARESALLSRFLQPSGVSPTWSLVAASCCPSAADSARASEAPFSAATALLRSCSTSKGTTECHRVCADSVAVGQPYQSGLWARLWLRACGAVQLCVHKAWAHLLQLLLQAGLPLQQCEALLLSKVKQLRQLTRLKKPGVRAQQGYSTATRHKGVRSRALGGAPKLGLAV